MLGAGHGTSTDSSPSRWGRARALARILRMRRLLDHIDVYESVAWPT